MKKIIHLTDIHIGFHKLEERFSKLLFNLQNSKVPASNYVIVITGDLVEEANEKNFQHAKYYIDALKNLGYDVLIVPGNHDYGNGISVEKDKVSLFKSTFLGDPNYQFPKLDIISDIAFIGLDSMVGETGKKDPFDNRVLAEGKIGDKQLNSLRDLLLKNKDSKKRVVYLHHHPFDTLFGMKLDDADELRKILIDSCNIGISIDALLFGHKHEGRIWNGCKGLEKIPRIYDGGSSTGKEDSLHPHRIIDFDKDSCTDYDAKFI